jgi:hypothetical protein
MMSNQAFERSPLDVSSFPESLQNHVKPDAPPPLKMMAARGMVPTPAEFTSRLLYQLSFDEVVGGEAKQALIDMPAAVLMPGLQSEQPPSVLDWIAELRPEDEDIMRAVLLNKGCANETVAHMATLANAVLCDTIANNQVRILAYPRILEELYKNPNTRMATVDKLIDLAQRNEVKLDGLPGLQAAIDAGEQLILDDGSSPDFDEFLKEQANAEDVDAEEEEEESNMSRLERLRAERAPKKEEEELTGPLYSRVQQMNLAQKVRLAIVGNREAINLLVKQSNRLVHMAAIKSPRLQFADIRKLSANKSMPDGVIRYIAGNREWTQHYEIKLNLVNNPKTPLADSISMVNHLRTNDLRMLMRNRNVSHQLARQAKTLVSKRAGS